MSRELSGVMDQLIVGWNSHTPDQALPFYHPACRGIDVGQARPQNGREGIRQTLRRYWDAFPDLTIVNHEMVIQDERAAVSWVGRGTPAPLFHGSEHTPKLSRSLIRKE